MTYDSPKRIRDRQNAANDKATRPRRTRQPIAIPTDTEWADACEAYVSVMNERIEAGRAEAAGRLAQHLAHAAIEFQARRIMRDFGRAYWKAIDMARHELLNCDL